MLTAWPDGMCRIAGGGKVGVELGTTGVLTLGSVGHAVAVAAGLDRLQEAVKRVKATRRENTDILVFKEHLQTKTIIAPAAPPNLLPGAYQPILVHVLPHKQSPRGLVLPGFPIGPALRPEKPTLPGPYQTGAG